MPTADRPRHPQYTQIPGKNQMKILDALKKEAIIVGLKASDKTGVIKELVRPAAPIAGVDEKELIDVLIERERLGSTGIGGGIGIPHGKLKNLESLVLGFGLSRKGVDFESIDGRPTYIFFLLVTPENSTGLHLKMLARISRILKDDPFRERLLKAADRDEVYAIIEEHDEEF
jgi:PTS system nitrogen regulatory IIA component